MNLLRPAILLVLVAGCLFAADPAETRQGAYRASIAQESVRNDADKVQTALAAIIAEAKLNGIGGDDAEALRPILAQLGTLTEQEMRTVIDSLKSAGLSSDRTHQQRRINDAVESQQAIASRLYTLAGNLGARQAKEALPRDLRQLLGRQLANLRLTLRLQLLPPEGNESARQTVASNQQSLAADIETILKELAELVTLLPPGEAEPFKVALDFAQREKITVAAVEAAETASSGDLAASVRHQARVRDILLGASQALIAKQTAAEQLVQMSETLERLIIDQSDLNAGTRIRGVDTAILSQRQTLIADQTGVLRTLNPALTPAVTTALEEGRLAMQDASGRLSAKDTGPATRAAQDAALAALRRARAELAKLMRTEQQVLADAARDLARAQEQLAQARENLRQQNNAAAAPLLNAANQSAASAADAPGLPPAALQAIAAARDDLAAATTAAGQNDNTAAQQAAANAAAALAAAQAAVAQAQAALDQQASSAAASAADQALQSLADAQTATAAAADTMSTGASAAEQAAAAQQASAAASAAAAAQTNAAATAAATQAAAASQAAVSAAQNGRPAAAEAALAEAKAALAAAQAAAQAAGGATDEAGTAGAGDPSGPSEGKNALLGGTGPAGGPGQVVTGLRPRDRAAISQAEADKTPPEFTPLVRQYLKNLADGVTP